MTLERWQQITEVFHLARAHDAVARATLLDEACADDVALRADVEEMLAADRAAGGFGDTPMFAAPTEQAPCLEPGARFGLYRIDALIGSGGMGEVYRAHDGRLDRDVAIKLLSATTVGDPDARLRLLGEARSAAALNHPHVCTIHEVGEVDGHAYIAMELIDGQPLDRVIPAGGLPVENLLRYGIQIADAIAHAHERGIVHRDVKPSNVMISHLGIAKVLDFGLAKTLSLVTPARLDFAASQTAVGFLAGTAAYMSPEQALARTTDERSDVFSCGSLLYEMATGRRAFTGDTPLDVLGAVVHATPVPASAVRRDLPAGLSQLIEKALSKERSQRYQRMTELREQLCHLDTRTVDDVHPVQAHRFRRRLITTGLAAAASIIAVSVWIGVPAVGDRSTVAEAVMPVGDLTGKQRIAVLPFENLTGQPDDDWLASAFADSVTFGLESLDSVILVSRNGIAQAYREHDLREAARLEPDKIKRLSRMLEIHYYIHGSYERLGDGLSVGARLVEVGSGAVKANESVTGRLANLLQLEDALARKFAGSLEPDRVPAPLRPDQTSLAAHRAITEGRGLYAAGRWQPALDSAKRAVDLDPEYAEAWALLGKSYARVAAPSSFAGGGLEEYRALARAAAKRAAELDSSSYEAHVALALAHRESAQYEPWRAAARTAIALKPRFSEGYALLADSFSETPAWGCPPDGNVPLAISYYRKALQIDPAVYAYYGNLSENLLRLGRLQEALEVVDTHVRLHPTNGAARRGRVLPLIELGRLDEAERMMREAIGDRGPLVQDHRDLAIIELRRGRLQAAASGFSKAIALRGHGWRPSIARQYIKAGVIAPALDHLEETFRAEPTCAQWLLATTSPYWAAIRSHPQARALLEKYSAR
jgi:eukaryotic-like serine/threonine-protein kinase